MATSGSDTKLPTKLRAAIRDLWDKPGTPVQEARALVAAVLGVPVRCNPDWSQLLAYYDGATPKPLYTDDRAQLATVVAGCVEVWCRVLADLLNEADGDHADAAQQAWTEAVVVHVAPVRCLHLVVEVAGRSGSGSGSKTAWLAESAAFVLRLPAHEPVVVPSDEALAYREGLLACFDKPPPAPAPAPASALAHRLANNPPSDDWADVAVDGATGTPAIVEPPSPPAAAANASSSSSPAATASPNLPLYERLPSVSSLPRPEDLLRRPPYHLRVADCGSQRVSIDGSHSPSLRLLGEYLERWCRTNHGDSRAPPAVCTKYRASCWATSTQTIDQVALSTADSNSFTISPPIVLAFVESVLGYTLVHTDGIIWTYRRVQPFKE